MQIVANMSMIDQSKAIHTLGEEWKILRSTVDKSLTNHIEKLSIIIPISFNRTNYYTMFKCYFFSIVL